MKKVNLRWAYLIVFAGILTFCNIPAFGSVSPQVSVLSPSQGQEYPYRTPVVMAFSIYDPDGDTDTSTMQLTVDGKDVTSKANISALLVTYTYSEGLIPGRHQFHFSVGDREKHLTEVDGIFYIAQKPQRERPYTISGSISMGGEYDKQATQSTVGTASLDMYGTLLNTFDYTLAVDLTNEQTSDSQRLSTYRMDVNTPYGGIVLGDTTPSFTDYSINGMQVFGFHLLPQIGPIGMEFVYGQSSKAVDDPETYTRMVYGAKLKIGSERGFLWGISLLKVKDDKFSLNSTTITPKDNLVLSTNFTLKLFKGVLAFKGEANESLLNEDITAGASDFSDLKLPFKPSEWEWLFTINEHIVPIIPGFTNLAAKASVTVGPLYDNTLTIEYSYVGPSYYSLGNTGAVNDKAGLQLWDNLWLLNKRLFTTFAYQHYRDNLENTNSETDRTNGYSGSLTFYPNDLLSISSSIDLLTVKGGATTDTSNTTINTGVTQNLPLWITNSYLNFAASANIFRDKVDNTQNATNYSIRTGAMSYFDTIPLDTKVVLGFDFGDVTSLYLEGRGGYRFLKNETLETFLDTIYQSSPATLDITSGVTMSALYDINIEASFEYIAPSGDLAFSTLATKEF